MKEIINFAHLFPLIPILLSIICPSGRLSTPATYTPRPSLFHSLPPICLCFFVFMLSVCSVSESIHLKSWESEEREHSEAQWAKKKAKNHILQKNTASPLPSPTPSYVSFFVVYKLFFFSCLCPLSDYFLADEKWGERERQRWKAPARIHDEETESKMI